MADLIRCVCCGHVRPLAAFMIAGKHVISVVTKRGLGRGRGWAEDYRDMDPEFELDLVEGVLLKALRNAVAQCEERIKELRHEAHGPSDQDLDGIPLSSLVVEPVSAGTRVSPRPASTSVSVSPSVRVRRRDEEEDESRSAAVRPSVQVRLRPSMEVA